VVRKAEQEIDESIREAGQKAIFDVGVHGVHPELVKLVGMLKYRYSYAQNVLNHSIETAFIAGAMAAELGLLEKEARRAGLLHDIGKAVDHGVEGSHAQVGSSVARKYGEPPVVCHAIEAHHGDTAATDVLDHIVDASNVLSGQRPGARKEMLELYVKRLGDLEAVATDFPGVEKAFAIQAGRELRVMVESSRVSDDQARVLSREIARKVESKLAYPGTVRVAVVRETRATDYAK
jgi:ribonuclease Y